jgi:hypothetical protein
MRVRATTRHDRCTAAAANMPEIAKNSGMRIGSSDRPNTLHASGSGTGSAQST